MHHTEPEVISPAITIAAVGCQAPNGALLWTVSAYVINGGAKIPVRAFIDSGSSLTFISPSLRHMITETPVGISNLNIKTLSGKQSTPNVPLFSIRLADRDASNIVELLAHEYDFDVNPPNLSPAPVLQAIRRFHESHPLADRAYLENLSAPAPAILIGMNQMHKLMCRNPPVTVIGEVLAYQTRFGWVIGGGTNSQSQRITGEVTAAHAICCSVVLAAAGRSVSSAAETVQRMWALDTIGITDPTSKTNLTTDEESALDQFQKSVSYSNNEYTVQMPKRNSIIELENNLNVARRRLNAKIRQLSKEPQRYARYHEEIMSFVNKGHAREIEAPKEAEATKKDGSYYMPHHEVVTIGAAGEKWRIVFDCSASERDVTALNHHLLPGPNLNPEIVTLLLNFRLHPVAISADITQAYMQIRVREEDRGLFRFLWQAPDAPTVRCFEMQKVTWGARPSGFLLAAVIREHLRKSDSSVQHSIGKSLYADDYLTSVPNATQAIETIRGLRSIFKSANMTWAKWKTNDDQVRNHLIKNEDAPPSINTTDSNILKVLGIQWVPREDELRFIMPDLSQRAQRRSTLTKRQALALVAGVYDPLGLLIPYSLRGKTVIQKLWSRNLQWDEQVPKECEKELTDWLAELRHFEGLRIARQFSPHRSIPNSYRLHTFCDASKTAYATVAYLESRYVDGPSQFAILLCKSRLAPRPAPSLPRLELFAALCAVRLEHYIISRLEIDFEQIRFYTDSTIAYHWVTAENPGSWRPFVCNRVHEIQKFSRPVEWYHVRGEENIADLATRGISAEALINSEAWWKALNWLRLPLTDHPTSQPRFKTEIFKPVEEELRKIVCPVISTGEVIDLERYSTAGRAVRVISNVLRFINKSRSPSANVSTSELRARAETLLIRSTQAKHLSEEINATRAGERVPSKSKLAAYNLFLGHEGVLRVKTRLNENPLVSFEEKNPAVVPPDSRLARLLVIDAHRINAHFGVSTVLTILRRRYWIIRARQIVKAILRRCVTCRRAHSRTASQIEAPLPTLRSTLHAPFYAAGLDYCGPFYTLQRLGKPPEKLVVKSYIAVYCCTATRAIHLEAVSSMSTPQTLLALRRFLATYPSCKHLISDNGSSFVKAATEIKKLYNEKNNKAIRDLLHEKAIEWTFQCPVAPWRGGHFERFVGITKKCLAKTLGRGLICYELFRTILCELTAVINNRPLTHVGSDVDENVAITPNNFLRGGPPSAPIAQFLSVDRLQSDGKVSSAGEFRKVLADRTTYFKNLSGTWFKEYLSLLRSANTTHGRVKRPITIGDVCILSEDKRPRVRWELVRVVDAHRGRDGQVRTYSIKFSDGKTLRRAAQCLVPLEAAEDDFQSSTSTGNGM